MAGDGREMKQRVVQLRERVDAATKEAKTVSKTLVKKVADNKAEEDQKRKNEAQEHKKVGY